ncbi:hypothetical protein HII17_05050 [Thalassotalea sp. M1531]|uniref:STAS/SEC14 domain-containing protein n=1 Tax=Thalassotalea algicola TaxID=2716224 RepID=A0A7Y0LD30_9GAMM|nr:hypothetical protein [Thalassotalea algicola]NMP30925.1 hypothetical protein [Thalassotalea algicola]
MFDKNRRHGSFEIKCEGNTLIVDAQGPFNKETIQDYQLALTAAIDQMNDSSWQQIIIMREESIFTPEALEQMYAVTHYRKSRGLNFSAIVFVQSSARTLIEHQLQNIYCEVGIEHQFFDDYDEAKDKIKQLEATAC